MRQAATICVVAALVAVTAPPIAAASNTRQQALKPAAPDTRPGQYTDGGPAASASSAQSATSTAHSSLPDEASPATASADDHLTRLKMLKEHYNLRSLNRGLLGYGIGYGIIYVIVHALTGDLLWWLEAERGDAEAQFKLGIKLEISYLTLYNGECEETRWSLA